MNRFLLLVLLALVVKQAPAQTPLEVESQQARSTTIITGRVVASSGNFPIANARVLARAAGGPSSMRMATTDDDGRFQLTNLTPANYVIRVVAAGYVADLVQADTPAEFHRPGENVTVRMIKGGVITGRVVNQNGQPMALARVRAVRVRDEAGNAVRDSVARDWTTDDRGVYRAYGLEPGAYVVSANLNSQFRQNAEAGSVGPTYHPSATLDTATPVNVIAGNESGGIDIRYRPEHAYAVRGTVVGNAAQGPQSATPGNAPLRRSVIAVTLSHAATGVAVAFTTIVSTTATSVFGFDAVPDGAYELTAQVAPGSKDAALAPPQRINVRGASVNDVVLTLTAMGSVSGRLALETPGSAEGMESCGEPNKTALQETLITASAITGRAAKQAPSLASLLPIEAQPDARGEFLLTNISAGKYSLNVKPQSSRWYVRDIAWEGPPAASGAVTQSRFSGLTLKSGERVQGLVVKLARGAASISGRVSTAEGVSLPARLHVYAVPVKREHADDVLRYAHAPVQPDGTFSLKHLAPDRYWLLLDLNQNGFLDLKFRAALRRDAERANITVDLQPCQQVSDHTLRFTP
ncbi:MAG TPA: carboxypeptidase regulatory-like domain-containing protein [Pyrinomonadaceae bacterium]|nr:carboxypeptidase regulatory-like domain-containing protein [Pyrinomonadaceae bacterium]